MPSTELIISISHSGELPPGFVSSNLALLLLLNDYLESVPDWAMQYFTQEGLSDEALPDAVFVPGDDDFPACVRLSADELADMEFLQSLIDTVREELKSLLEQLYPLTLTFQIPADQGF